MPDIVLSAATRQSLLAAKDTADLLATTQNRLATGKKVNSALDNPNSFFTAAGLDARANDISNVLDSISNGVQVIQAANSGITSLQKLVDSAKAVASQALQTTTGFSQKSSVTSAAIAGATAANILGTTYTAATSTGAAVNSNNSTTPTGINASTTLAGAANTAGGNAMTTANGFTATDTLTVNGKTISFAAGAAPAAGSVTAGSGVSGQVVTDSLGNSTVYLGTGSMQDLMNAIDIAIGNKTVAIASGSATLSTASGATVASITAGALSLSTGTTSDLVVSGSAVAKIGLTAGTTARTNTNSGQILTVGSTGGGTASTIIFGTGANQVSTLAQLNAALAPNNLAATIDTTGALTLVTTNDAASSTVGTIGGTFAGAGKAFSAANGAGGSTPVPDTNSQATRQNLINQFNGILDQISTTSQDASYNGINLLNGDTLKLVFNETGKSTLSLTGVNFSFGGLGLAKLGQGANATASTNEFRDTASINKVIDAVTFASTTLRTQASGFGTNLSMVQARQTFNKTLINVLQTGSANLVNADLNEEAANSQALSTRQSLTVSSLSLASQAQQAVLQLLR